MINGKYIQLLFVYFFVRLFSYFFGPATPLQPQSWPNTVLSLIILSTAIFWLIKKDIRGWYIIAGEILLGGAGGFLAVGPISLRTALLASSISIYACHHCNLKIINSRSISNVRYSIFLLMVIAFFSATRGLLNGHGARLIFADIVPYLFLLYFFPLRELVQSEKFKSFAWNALVTAVIGNAIFILITILGFSGGLFQMQGAYYHWFRDVALGKITELGFDFYRLVLNEHLLLIPVLLFILNKLISKKTAGLAEIVSVCCSLFILSLNLTRIYMVALGAGVIFLFNKKNWRRWLVYSAGAGAAFIFIFTATHLSASRGHSLGWELFGLRLQSIASPQIEDSSLSRMLVLPKIWEKIKQNPIFGAGLGDTVAVFSPIFNKQIITPHFDWGYLEILAEMGLFGLMAWIILLYFTYKKAKENYLLPMLAALIVVNITSPALFHVMGILLLVIILNFNKYASENTSGLSKNQP